MSLGEDQVYTREGYKSLKAKLPQGFDEKMNRLAHPDRVRDQDVDRLNLQKQIYQEDVHQKVDRDYQNYLGIMQIIKDHLRKEFRIKRHGAEDSLIKDDVAPRKKYLVIHFSECFELPRRFYFPAEFAVAEFSVYNGLGKGVSGLIDIKKVPLGYDGDVRRRRKLTCNPHPPFDTDFDPWEDALKIIQDFCGRHFTDGEKVLLFTPKEFIPIVHNGLEWLLEESKSNHPDLEIKPMDYCLLPFSCLLQALINESQFSPNRKEGEENHFVVHHESNLSSILTDMTYGYAPELGCGYHSLVDNEAGVQYCSENIVKRLIYNACGPLSRCWNFKATSSLHWPRYLQTVPSISRGKGFKVHEIQRPSRYIGVQRFGGSDTMSERLGWTSGSSSASSSYSGSSGESTISADGEDSVRTKELDRVPGSLYGETELARQLQSRSKNYCHSIDGMSDISRSSSPRSPSTSVYSSSRPTYSEAFQQYTEDGGTSDASSDAEGKVTGRSAGRGVRRCVKYSDSVGSTKTQSSSRIAIEPGRSREMVVPLARSNVEKLSSSYEGLKIGTGSTVGWISSDGTSVRTAGRGMLRFRRDPSVSPSVVSDSSEGEGEGQFLGWGRTYKVAPSVASTSSTEESCSVSPYRISDHIAEDDEDADDQDIDSITVVAMRHAHGSHNDDTDTDTEEEY